MKRKNIWTLFCIIGLYLFTPQQSYAQSGATSALNKSNQEQIVQEFLSEVRERIIETKTRQVKKSGMIEETKKQVKAEVIPQSELKRISGEIDELKQREERLTEQESQLSAELDAERVKLITLNRRLDELGQEAAGAGDEKRTDKKDDK